MRQWECGGVSLHSHSFSPLPGGLPPPPGLPTSAIPLKTAPEFRNRGRYAACDNLSGKRENPISGKTRDGGVSSFSCVCVFLSHVIGRFDFSLVSA